MIINIYVIIFPDFNLLFQLQCCGLDSFEDWGGKLPSGTPGTETFQEGPEKLVIPISCCVDTCSSLYGNGCLPRVEFVVGRSALMLAGAAVSIALLQVSVHTAYYFVLKIQN